METSCINGIKEPKRKRREGYWRDKNEEKKEEVLRGDF